MIRETKRTIRLTTPLQDHSGTENVTRTHLFHILSRDFLVNYKSQKSNQEGWQTVARQNALHDAAK